MIKQQVLHGFQAHTHSVLNYHPGVNVVIGSGDMGKSSIRRGLTWVRANRPLGDGFIHDDSDDCYVRLLLEDAEGDTTIERGRDRKDSNYYKLNGDELVAFGANTPEVITQALAMEDINFQDQMTPYFLVVKTPGESAHYIRELMGLNIIDEAVSNLAGKIKRSNAIISSLECETEENDKALLAMEELQLDHFQVLLVQTQNYAKSEQDLVFKLSNVNSKIAEYNQIQAKLDSIPDNIEATIRLAEEQQETCARISQSTGFVQQRIVDYDECVKNFIIIKDFVQKMEEAEKQADDLQRAFLWHRSLQLPIDAYDECVKHFVVVEPIIKQMEEAEGNIDG